MTRYILPFVLAAPLAISQPAISRNGIVNSATYRTPGLPNSGIAQGSIFTIFGSGVGPDTLATAAELPLKTALGGTSVVITVAGSSTNALVLLASSKQVNAIIPSDTPIGTGTIAVTYNGQTSAPQSIQVVGNSFGIYTVRSSGFGEAIATDLSYRQNSIIQTFHPGDWVTLWGTGLGAVPGDDASAPSVGAIPGPVSIHVGTSNVTAAYAGRAGVFPGLDQVNFQLPDGVSGCYVPVAVETANGVSNVPMISVSAEGQTCSDSILGASLVSKLAAGTNVAFGYVRLESLFNSGSGSKDYAYATFSNFTPQTAGMAVYGVSRGYCAAGSGGPLGFSDLSQGQMNAGSALSAQGQGSLSIPYTAGFYRSYGGGSKFLWSDLNYSLSAPGGQNIGSFTVGDITSVGTAYFAADTASQLSLSADLTLRWTGGDPGLQNGLVTIQLSSSSDPSYTLFAAIQCTAPVGDHSFSVPRWVLSLLPPSGLSQTGAPSYPLGTIAIGQYSNGVPFEAQGLDQGILTDAFFNGLLVAFR